MKTLKCLLIVIPVIVLHACSGGVATKNNEFLGEIPALNKGYLLKMEAKEKAIEQCTDLEVAFKLEKEKKLLQKEHANRMEQYICSSSLCGQKVPYQSIEHDLFSTQGVVLDTIYSSGNVQFLFTLKAKDGIKSHRCTPFIYFKATDKEGNSIVNATSVATPYRINIEPGLEFTAKGILEAYTLEDFAKIIEITEDEYKKLKS
ncbi:MAG: hypothetical protein JEZ14_20390 [Marinilabiliaceae bacterium]|nr:hypothetical protein [Marinilabiliaceae bacterium]